MFMVQGDGNLVVYDTALAPLWASSTNGQPVDFVVMQDDGNLVAYSSNGAPRWSTGTHGQHGGTLVMQDDGDLVVYAPGSRPVWASRGSTLPPPAPALSRNMRQGYSGADVRVLQRRLAELGFPPGAVDGVFGPRTLAAVKGFQIARGLAADGIVGAKTWSALWQ